MAFPTMQHFLVVCFSSTPITLLPTNFALWSRIEQIYLSFLDPE
jgi:hypothetical protein